VLLVRVRRYAEMTALLGTLSVVACSHSTRTDTQAVVAQALPIALSACDQWSALLSRGQGALPGSDEVLAVERVANDATNHDLEFVVLRDNLHAAYLAARGGNHHAWTDARRRVDTNCAAIRDGTYRDRLNSG
jgi:hypothetical protein